MKKVTNKFALVSGMIVLLLLSACSTTLVAPYDPQVRMLLVRTSVKVDDFWARMMTIPAQDRQYQVFKERYYGIELDLKVLLRHSQLRSQNEESMQQAENLLTLWQQDIAKHQQKDGFKDFLLKRRIKEYQRMFNAMIVAEDAKQM